jgi:hypothetical protein
LEVDVRWFELAPHVGVNPDGSPQPLVEEGMRILTETKNARGQWVPEVRVVRLRPAIPGSRIVQTDDEAVAALLSVAEKWREIDPPRALRPRRPRESQSPRRRR